MYVGYAATQEWPTAGSTSGFTYDVSSAGDLFVYNTDASGVLNPLATQSPAGSSYAVAATLKATATTANVVTAAGSLAVAEGTGQSTLSVNPQHVGDALILGVGAVSSSSIDVTAGAVAGPPGKKSLTLMTRRLGSIAIFGSVPSQRPAVRRLPSRIRRVLRRSPPNLPPRNTPQCGGDHELGHREHRSQRRRLGLNYGYLPLTFDEQRGRALRRLRPDTQRRDRWVDERFYL